jgi:hypothetical protein
VGVLVFSSDGIVVVVGFTCLPVAFQQGRHRPDMGGVSADEVRAKEGPRRGQPRASRRRIRASRDILFSAPFFFSEILPIPLPLVLCGVVLSFLGVGLNSCSHKMTATIKRTTRVIGWYHSHPHITVLPSHVGKQFTFPPPANHFVPRVAHLCFS